ncbi:hypothetical protein SDRG_08597 [Saprolegnia diclina VS20]|uniref:Protein kinase domain-containing protein n=1 Tax=Saprolegnia diclina (strain VS20) TaxID=1156394 RepID=T0RU40_SAPDV|nr:hypothetical protein SDRG_08597 [Saprolegnia diclina VS20]EQC33917.1 hypothetical protein SDRG_08597 [Saprolegnia diclina VS20]|eukprot:XP_008612712.1 hypothetical protein SDRG_08597 [Saprolegnia diclina VS20]
MGTCLSKDSSALVLEPQPRHAPVSKSLPRKKDLPTTDVPVFAPMAAPRSSSDASTVTDSLDVKLVVVTPLPSSEASSAPASPTTSTQNDDDDNVPDTGDQTMASPASVAPDQVEADAPLSPPFQPHVTSPMTTLAKTLQSSSTAMFFPLYGVRSTQRKSYVPMLETVRHKTLLPSYADAVHFAAYGPPNFAAASHFGLSIWAFLATYDAAASSPLPIWLQIERGQMVHVTLHVPEIGYSVADGETKSFVWDHHATHVHFDVVVLDATVLGQPFFADVVAGPHVLRLAFQLATLSDAAGALTQAYPSQAMRITEQARTLASEDFDVAIGATTGSYNGTAVNVDALHDASTVDALSARMQQMSHHPRIARILGVAKLHDHMHWVSEHKQAFTLHTYLGQRLTNDEKTDLMRDIAAGLAHMHECGLAHNSVSTRHCIVDLDGRVTLGGFSAVAVASTQAEMAVDVLEFGYVLWEAFTDVPATDIGSTWHEIVVAVELGPSAATMPLSIQALLLACLSEDIARRPTMVDVVDALGGAKPKSIMDTVGLLKMA